MDSSWQGYSHGSLLEHGVLWVFVFCSNHQKLWGADHVHRLHHPKGHHTFPILFLVSQCLHHGALDGDIHFHCRSTGKIASSKVHLGEEDEQEEEATTKNTAREKGIFSQ